MTVAAAAALWTRLAIIVSITTIMKHFYNCKELKSDKSKV
jgi:hypothetical protein